LDRGAKKYFDNIKHIDIYVSDHKKAQKMGVMWKRVKVIRQAKGDQR